MELLNEGPFEPIYNYQGGPDIPPILQELRQSIKPAVSDTNKPSQLLFISDIEGCLEKQGQIDQNVSLCDVKNYLPSGPLFKFLLNNSKNKIAFLGDYFDKGPGVALSIRGITFLHKCFPDRVHIILGNRDVNKFRLGYEVIQQQTMTPVTDPLDNTKWIAWKDFYPLYNQSNGTQPNDNFQRFTTILNKSMAAGPNPNGAIISHSIQNAANNANIGAYYLTKVFDDNVQPLHFGITDADISKPDLNTFVNDCRYLFKNGDIVKGDADYKVLMSHAGGFNKCILQSESFYNGIMRLQKKRKYEETIVESNKKPRIPGGDPSNPNYFDEMERMRRALDCEDIMDIDEDIITIDEAVIYHNKLYTDFVNAYFKYPTIRNTTLLPQHLLLQAMGLKPDPNKPQSKFASFIQSCGSGCGILGDNESNEFILNLHEYKAVAHGHVPHCMRHPLLINRGGIVFISNDTSNGNRPKELGELLSKLPLSYIQRINVDIKYGIGFIETDGTIRTPNFHEMKFKNNGTEYTNQDATVYNTLALIGGPYSLNDIPTIPTIPTTDTVKKYIAWNGFAPGDIIVPPSGGSNTRKNQKRGGKKNTRRIVKNNRKTKRRSKHHCSHCK